MAKELVSHSSHIKTILSALPLSNCTYPFSFRKWLQRMSGNIGERERYIVRKHVPNAHHIPKAFYFSVYNKKECEIHRASVRKESLLSGREQK